MDDKERLNEAKKGAKAIRKQVDKVSRRQSLKRWGIFGGFVAANYMVLHSPGIESSSDYWMIALLVTGIGWLSNWTQGIVGIGDGTPTPPTG